MVLAIVTPWHTAMRLPMSRIRKARTCPKRSRASRALKVLAYGSSRSRDDDAAETGYYGVRLALGYHFSVPMVANGASVAEICSIWEKNIKNSGKTRLITVSGTLIFQRLATVEITEH